MSRGTLRALGAAIVLCALPCGALAHGARATMDAGGSSAGFTGLARVTCFDDGNGPAAYLTARVRDDSPPVAGLLVSLQLLKGTVALNTTDPVSGDADWSTALALPGGNGVYTMLLNKTAAGARTVDLEWHCITSDNQHTGTEIIVDQFN